MALKGLVKRIPFLFFAFSVGLGIWLARFFKEQFLPFSWIPVAVVLVFFLCILYTSHFAPRYRSRWLPGGCFFLLLLAAGFYLAVFYRPIRIKNSFRVECTALVEEANITYSGYHSYTVAPLRLKTDTIFTDLRTMKWRLIVEPYDSLLMPSATPGDLVEFCTSISGHDKPSNPDTFDYGKYLFRQGISGWGFVEKEQFRIVENSRLPGIRGYMNEMRGKTIEIYRENGIVGDELQVLSALTLGVRGMLDDEIKNWFVHSGAIHVLAVSGLHTGVIFLLINWLLDLFLPKRSSVRVIIVVGVLVFYAMFTGGAPSVLRAVVMLSVIQIGKYSQKSSNVYNLLGVSAFIILLVHPMSLYHIGFWLSHLAVAGIVTFYPVFEKLYSDKKLFVRWLGDLAAVSLSAQIGTLPLSLFTFRAFPTWFLLSNFFVLPLVAPILVLAKFLVIFSEFRFLSLMLAGVLNDLLGFMLGVVEWLDSLPHSYVKGLWINEVSVWVLYLGIIAFMLWHHTRLRSLFKGTFFLMLLFLIVVHLDYYRKSQTTAFVVFDVKRQNVFGMIESGQGIIIADSITSDRQIDFACSGFFARNSFNVKRKFLSECWNTKGEAMVCSVGKRQFLVLGNVNVNRLKFNSNTPFEGVVLSGNVKGDVTEFLSQISSKRLIVAKTCPPWCIDDWQDQLEKSKMEVHFIAENGAYLFR
jgi:competence protein ComEC